MVKLKQQIGKILYQKTLDPKQKLNLITELQQLFNQLNKRPTI